MTFISKNKMLINFYKILHVYTSFIYICIDKLKLINFHLNFTIGILVRDKILYRQKPFKINERIQFYTF